MWVAVGIFYGLVAWASAMLYAMIVGGEVVIVILIAPFIISTVTIIFCAIGFASDYIKSRHKAG